MKHGLRLPFRFLRKVDLRGSDESVVSSAARISVSKRSSGTPSTGLLRLLSRSIAKMTGPARELGLAVLFAGVAAITQFISELGHRRALRARRRGTGTRRRAARPSPTW